MNMRQFCFAMVLASFCLSVGGNYVLAVQTPFEKEVKNGYEVESSFITKAPEVRLQNTQSSNKENLFAVSDDGGHLKQVSGSLVLPDNDTPKEFEHSSIRPENETSQLPTLDSSFDARARSLAFHRSLNELHTCVRNSRRTAELDISAQVFENNPIPQIMVSSNRNSDTVLGRNSPYHRELAQNSMVKQFCRDAVDTARSVCDYSLHVPNDVKVNYQRACTNNCCEWDCGQNSCTNNCCTYKCESKKCTNNCCSWSCGGFIPCTGCSKSRCGERCVSDFIPCTGCSKHHCGETCVNVPCTGCSKQHCDEKCDDIPTSLSLVYGDVSVCNLVGFSGYTSLFDKAEKVCSCIDDAIELSSGGAAEIIDSGEINEATTELLKMYGDMVECFAGEALSPISEKTLIISKETDKGGLVLWGPEIGISLYTQFSSTIVLCIVSEGSKCDDIFNVLANYFEETLDQMADHIPLIMKLLKCVILEQAQKAMFNFEEKSIVAVSEFSQAASCVESAASNAQELKQAFRRSVETVSDTTENIAGLFRATSQTIASVGPAIDAIEDAFTAAGVLTTSFEGHLINLIMEGKLPDISAVVDFLKNHENITGLISSVNSVLEEIGALRDNINRLEGAIDETVVLINKISNEFDDCKSKILSKVEQTKKSVNIVFDFLSKIGDSGGFSHGFEFPQAGVASYSSFVDVQIQNLPCSKLTEKTFHSNICPVCEPVVASVPEFYPCSWEGRIPMPKEHMPYLRLFIPKVRTESSAADAGTVSDAGSTVDSDGESVDESPGLEKGSVIEDGDTDSIDGPEVIPDGGYGGDGPGSGKSSAVKDNEYSLKLDGYSCRRIGADNHRKGIDGTDWNLHHGKTFDWCKDNCLDQERNCTGFEWWSGGRCELWLEEIDYAVPTKSDDEDGKPICWSKSEPLSKPETSSFDTQTTSTSSAMNVRIEISHLFIFMTCSFIHLLANQV